MGSYISTHKGLVEMTICALITSVYFALMPTPLAIRAFCQWLGFVVAWLLLRAPVGGLVLFTCISPFLAYLFARFKI